MVVGSTGPGLSSLLCPATLGNLAHFRGLSFLVSRMGRIPLAELRISLGACAVPGEGLAGATLRRGRMDRAGLRGPSALLLATDATRPGLS